MVVPFNQASQQDVQALVDYIYEKEKEDLDFIVPFAALSENGRDLGGLDSHSELAHRIMLTNLLRLVGAVKNKKEAKKIVTHPVHVLLPLSPNHGIFGSDGLYDLFLFEMIIRFSETTTLARLNSSVHSPAQVCGEQARPRGTAEQVAQRRLGRLSHTGRRCDRLDARHPPDAVQQRACRRH